MKKLLVWCLLGLCLHTVSPFTWWKKITPKPYNENHEELNEIIDSIAAPLRNDDDFEKKIKSTRDKINEHLDALNTIKKEIDVKDEIEGNIIEISDDAWDKIGSANNLDQISSLLGIQLNEVIGTSNSKNAIETDIIERSRPGGKLASGIVPRGKSAGNSISDYWAAPERAGCKPEERTLDLELQNSRRIKHFPTCVRVKQCGGCCSTKEHECQPVTVRDIAIMITKLSKIHQDPRNINLRARARGSARRGRRRRGAQATVETFNKTIAEHTQCRCSCKLRETECDLSVHKYNDRLCTCDCFNEDDEAKCLNSSGKLWNRTQCSCECREKKICSTGLEFDEKFCKCIVPKNEEINNGPGDYFYY